MRHYYAIVVNLYESARPLTVYKLRNMKGISMNIKILMAMLCCLPVLSGSATAEIYKWVDGNGLTHYASKAPKSQSAVKLKISKGKAEPMAKSSSYSLPQAEKINSPSVASAIAANSAARVNISGQAFPQKITDKNYDQKNLQKADFSKRSIRRTSFNQSQMQAVSFKNADLIEVVSFIGADLTGADFSHAFMSKVDFTAANLTGANFDFTSCFECIFDKSKMEKVLFTNTTLNKVSFKSADLKDSQMTAGGVWSEVNLIGARGIDFVQLHQQVKKNPSGIDHIVYEVNGCIIGQPGADCSASDLSGHKFLSKELRGVNFSKANLSNADFSLTALFEVNFSGATLLNASFGKKAWKSDFSEADLTGADFYLTSLHTVKFDQARLEGVKINPSLVNPSLLLQADISGCKECQSLVEARKVDFDSLRQDIIEFSAKPIKPVTADYSKWLRFQYQYGTYISSRSTLSMDQYIDLILLTLRANNPAFIKDVFFLINGFSHQGLKDTICKNKEVVSLMLPLLHLSNDEFDAKAKNTLNGFTPSEQIRYEAISCLSPNMPHLQQVTAAFKKAFGTETHDQVKARLLLAYQDGSRESEMVLIDALKSGYKNTSKRAAIYLKDAITLPNTLYPWLLNYIEAEKYEDEAYFHLLKKYKVAAKPDIERLIKIEQSRSNNKLGTSCH